MKNFMEENILINTEVISKTVFLILKKLEDKFPDKQIDSLWNKV